MPCLHFWSIYSNFDNLLISWNSSLFLYLGWFLCWQWIDVAEFMNNIQRVGLCGAEGKMCVCECMCMCVCVWRIRCNLYICIRNLEFRVLSKMLRWSVLQRYSHIFYWLAYCASLNLENKLTFKTMMKIGTWGLWPLTVSARCSQIGEIADFLLCPVLPPACIPVMCPNAQRFSLGFTGHWLLFKCNPPFVVLKSRFLKTQRIQD